MAGQESSTSQPTRERKSLPPPPSGLQRRKERLPGPPKKGDAFRQAPTNSAPAQSSQDHDRRPPVFTHRCGFRSRPQGSASLRLCFAGSGPSVQEWIVGEAVVLGCVASKGPSGASTAERRSRRRRSRACGAVVGAAST